MYTHLAEIPVPVSATFVSRDAVQIAYSSTNYVSRTKKTLTRIVPLGVESQKDLPFQELGDVITFTISPSFKHRANLREIKQDSSTKRFVEIWACNKIEISFEVTEYHQSFYLDENLSTLTFSPSETALLYTAEVNAPKNTTDDPYAKYRYKPTLGEGSNGKKQPRFFLFRWNSPIKPDPSNLVPVLYEIRPENDNVLFGQGIFSSAPEEDTIYATGYEYTPNGRFLGLRWCFNRPFGVWELRFQTQPTDDSVNGDKKKRECTIYSVRKVSDTNSSRSARLVQEDSKSALYWLSSDAGGPHMSTSSLQSLDLTTSRATTSEDSSDIRTVLPIPQGVGQGFPGFYPPFNLLTCAFLQHGGSTELIAQSQWGLRTTILSINCSTGVVRDLTPPEPELFSWAALATDGKNRIICSRSSPAIPYQVFLGVVSGGDVQWSVIDQPDLAPRVSSALQTIRTSIHPIPDRHPVETMVIRSVTGDETQERPKPLITTPHGGPHAGVTTAFSAAATALVLEGYTLSAPNYTGTPGYGQSEIYRLLGQCGTLDVEDVHASTLHVVNNLKFGRFREGEIFVWGGSHGGFISAHLISRYPDIYSAAILGNPVINCVEVAGTDIPDWYFAEFGFQGDFPLQSAPRFSDLSAASKCPTKPNFDAAPHVTPRVFEGLYNASASTALINYLSDRSRNPIEGKRVPPVLLLIGSSDQRVSPSQGIGFYHLLKGAGEEVEMLVFEGEGHSIDSVEALKVGWEAGRDWLQRFRNKEL